MKKHLLLLAALLVGLVSCQYDDESLWNAVDNLDKRVSTLEELCNKMNENILSLQTVVNALQKKDLIESVIELPDKCGYTINFTSGKSINIYNGVNGKNGEDGIDGETPIISVKQDADGIYYWTIDGKWLIVDDQKVKAIGTDGVDGKPGEDGKDGVTPRLKIEEGYWYISYDNEMSWERLGKATGENGADGINVFKSVAEDDKNVYFTLADDSVITIPKCDMSEFSISFTEKEISVINGGEIKTISYKIFKATENTIVKAIAKDGWKVSINPISIDSGTITITAPENIINSEILIFANDGSYRTVMAVLQCSEKMVLIVSDTSFEMGVGGGIKEVNLTTNMKYTIDIPQNAKSWLSLIETRATREESIIFNISPNDGLSRFAVVSLKNEHDKVVETIIFRQNGTGVEVNVETKGKLEATLADYDYINIESLKITGILSDIDFLFIYHMMPNLKNLDISEVALTTLPTKAFYQSTNIENVLLPNTLTDISSMTFAKSKLKSITIPNRVTTIESQAFYDCLFLTNVYFEQGSQLKEIPPHAFLGCEALQSITIPASVKELSGFSGCYSLKNIIFEQGSQLEYLSDLSGCEALQSITIPASVKIIGVGTFNGCSSLKNIIFEQGTQLERIGKVDADASTSTFSGCEALQSITIPASVKELGKYVFSDCHSLTNIIFEQGSQIEKICNNTFSGCEALQSITIPASVKIIETAAFYGCSSLTRITFEQGSQLTHISGGQARNQGAFSQLKNLIIVDMANCLHVSSIGANTFYGASKLRLFQIGTNIPPDCDSKYFPNDAFLNISSDAILKVPKGYTDAYKAANEWWRFSIVTELDE